MIIKNFVKRILKIINLYSLYDLRFHGPLYEDGWFRSFKDKQSVDKMGNPLPWITYPAIDFLRKRIQPNMVVFEYGCGGSTIWWANRVKRVYSVEHNLAWYQMISSKIPSNVTIYNINLEYGGEYSKKINEVDEKFDIVIIDGRDRINCAFNSIKALKEDGIIIWDNSDREEYERGYQFLFEQGFKKIEFLGMVPIINMKNETSIFYRETNCLNI